ncbi:dihydropteroate synthase [Candidatus Oleimmundimicrobium sp.]|uniref:dihydropteroate synthase n=1 Tax=Candidatus Oleimmundimicrobium sp. TaxID=3060597 RepID=UPI0027191F47|nr:dihydropteroate synthase [Candidatus Oleimmundimicrobium sp.]MDO8885917.1 dihydropteroate synthase [Candidatus Oleimmundimicrobium sp.]
MSCNARVLILKESGEIKKAFEKIGVDPMGIKIMVSKAIFRIIKLEGLNACQANILKQEMLVCGGEVAISKTVYSLTKEHSDVILIGTITQFDKLCKKLTNQPFNLKKISKEIDEVLRNFDTKPQIIKAGKSKLDLNERTHLMGILNITPDSFSDGGSYFKTETAVSRGIAMVEEGADIIDVGGESTRPGVESVSLEEELKRVIPVIERLACEINCPISIDTYKSEVAKKALEAGATIVNDISGFQMDKNMPKLVAKTGVPIIIMHMQGTPEMMQKNPHYECVMREIISFLREKAEVALKAGVQKDKIIIDPGIGFGKTREHNLEIMRKLPELKNLGYPILIGTSRKSFIGTTLNLPVEDRLEGTAATVAYSIVQGANIIRVHDVKEMVRVAKMTDAMVRG